LPLGAPAPDAPVLVAGRADWLLRHIGADGRFTLLCFGEVPPEVPAGITPLLVADDDRAGALWDHSGLVARRWQARHGDALLLRPDQHLAARLHQPSVAEIAAAHRRALGHA
jgi:3-(3-hydroxy-phenyl)propionate hydroxylase